MRFPDLISKNPISIRPSSIRPSSIRPSNIQHPTSSIQYPASSIQQSPQSKKSRLERQDDLYWYENFLLFNHSFRCDHGVFADQLHQVDAFDQRSRFSDSNAVVAGTYINCFGSHYCTRHADHADADLAAAC
jgi:hypothetical protein